MVKTVKNIVFNCILYFGMIWVSTAITFNTYMLYLHFSNQDKKIKVITKKINKVIDKIR